jgi:hypothetical protein
MAVLGPLARIRRPSATSPAETSPADTQRTADTQPVETRPVTQIEKIDAAEVVAS